MRVKSQAIRYQGEEPKSQSTSVFGPRCEGMKWFRNSVGAMVELKQEGQMSKEGHLGRVSQSVFPQTNLVRGHEGRGVMAPRSTSSEWRR